MNIRWNIASQLGLMSYGHPYRHYPSIGRIEFSCADYNANNTWYFNGNNGCINNNNRNYASFRSRPALDYDQYDNGFLEQYPIPLIMLFSISRRAEKCKKSKPSYSFFSLHRIEELILLTHQLNNFELLPREGTSHIIKEPKVRQIICSHAAERVIQTLYISLMQPYLEQYMYHKDSYSCRPKKGSLCAIRQLVDYIYEVTDGYTKDAYLVKRDIRAFFMSLSCQHIHDTIIRFIDAYMSDSPLIEYLKYLTRFIYLSATKDHLKNMARPDEIARLEPHKNIKNNPYYIGVPIGNWTSQASGLIETTVVLRYMESLGLKFIHYTDDNTAVVTNKGYWRDCDMRIERLYNSELGLRVHPDKKYMQHYSKGVELLGYKVRFGRILLNDRTYNNLMACLKHIKEMSENKALVVKDKIRDSINSYIGMLRHISGFRLRRKICRAIGASDAAYIFDIADNFTKITIRKNFSTSNYYQSECKALKNNINKNHKLWTCLLLTRC